MKNQHGYDAGGLDEVSTPQNNDKVFIRTDFNVSPKNQLTVRMNYVDGSKAATTTGVPNHDLRVCRTTSTDPTEKNVAGRAS